MVPNPAGILRENGIPLSVFTPPSAHAPAGTDPDDVPDYDFWDWLMTNRPGVFGTIGGFANPTGVALMVVLTVMFICSMTWVRKGGYFEVSQF